MVQASKDALEPEIKQVYFALIIFAVSFIVRVIRNTVLVVIWDPCYTVNHLLFTSLFNLLFYIICDFVPVAVMLRMHQVNYSSAKVGTSKLN